MDIDECKPAARTTAICIVCPSAPRLSVIFCVVVSPGVTSSFMDAKGVSERPVPETTVLETVVVFRDAHPVTTGDKHNITANAASA